MWRGAMVPVASFRTPKRKVLVTAALALAKKTMPVQRGALALHAAAKLAGSSDDVRVHVASWNDSGHSNCSSAWHSMGRRSLRIPGS